MSPWLWSFCWTQGAVGGEARPDQGWTRKRSRAREEIGRATPKRPGQARVFLYSFLFVFVFILIFCLLGQARVMITINEILLWTFQSGRFKKLPRRIHLLRARGTSLLWTQEVSKWQRWGPWKVLVFVDFLFKRPFLLCDKFFPLFSLHSAAQLQDWAESFRAAKKGDD